MDIRYDISQLFEVAFGTKFPVFLPYPVTIGASGKNVHYGHIRVKEQGAYERISSLGTPVANSFSFKGGCYKKYSATGELEEVQLNDFELPIVSLVDFTRAKNIIKTQVLGSNGSVKELFSFDDWSIRIRGLCLDDHSRLSDKKALEQKMTLLAYHHIAGAINVMGDLFLEKDIHALCMNDLIFKLLEGHENAFSFEMSCNSDEPLELTL